MFKKTLILSTLITFIYAGDTNLIPTSPIAPIEKTFMDNHFLFVSGGLNKNKVDSKLASGESFKVGALDDKGFLFEAGVGYRFNKNIFSTVSYQKEVLDILHKDNYLVSLNYQLKDTFLAPFFGAVGGYSTLNWDKPPYELQLDNDFDSTGFVFGGQVGVEYSFTEKTSIFSKYQFLTTDHKMNILFDTNTIEHKDTQNIQLGVRYEF